MSDDGGDFPLVLFDSNLLRCERAALLWVSYNDGGSSFYFSGLSTAEGFLYRFTAS